MDLYFADTITVWDGTNWVIMETLRNRRIKLFRASVLISSRT